MRSNRMKTKTHQTTIYIAGDIPTIKATCRAFCLRGECVTITPTDFVYLGASETGAAIGLINYPPFETTPDKQKENARELAECLMAACSQRSCTLVSSDETEYLKNQAVSAQMAARATVRKDI